MTDLSAHRKKEAGTFLGMKTHFLFRKSVPYMDHVLGKKHVFRKETS